MTSRRHRVAIVLIISTLAFVASCSLVMVPSRYGFGHEAYRDWVRPDMPGSSCCSERDCAPTQERIVGDGYEALLDGQWVKIPPSKILRKPSPDGQPHLCALPSGEVLCFLPGQGA